MSMDKKQEVALKISKEIQTQMEELIGGVHHEINNLIFIIQGSMEIVEISHDPEKKAQLTDGIKKLAQEIEELSLKPGAKKTAATTVSEKTQELLDLVSKIEEDNQQEANKKTEMIKNVELKSKEITKLIAQLRAVVKDSSSEDEDYFSLQEVAASVSSLCKRRFNNHKVMLKTVLDNSIQIKAKKNQVLQAFLNVLNSSHDAVASSKETSKWIEFSFVEAKGKLEIFIKDNSALVKTEDLGSLFDPEFSKGGRKGLSLVISKNIIEENGGNLEYRQVDGRNCFVISFEKYLNILESEAEANLDSEEDETSASNVQPIRKTA